MILPQIGIKLVTFDYIGWSLTIKILFSFFYNCALLPRREREREREILCMHYDATQCRHWCTTPLDRWSVSTNCVEHRSPGSGCSVGRKLFHFDGRSCFRQSDMPQHALFIWILGFLKIVYFFLSRNSSLVREQSCDLLWEEQVMDIYLVIHSLQQALSPPPLRFSFFV